LSQGVPGSLKKETIFKMTTQVGEEKISFWDKWDVGVVGLYQVLEFTMRCLCLLDGVCSLLPGAQWVGMEKAWPGSSSWGSAILTLL
jgi:hypothetical protein